MRTPEPAGEVSRRALLKTGGALLVSWSLPIEAGAAPVEADARGAVTLRPDTLSSYLAVHGDGAISAFFGKVDMGQGLLVAIGQIVAEELDVRFDRVTVIAGDSSTSVNQGDASAQCGVQSGGKQMRVAAAEARRVLVDMAASHLRLPAEELTVTDGVVHAIADPTRRRSYGELIGARRFDVALAWNGKIGNDLYAPGRAKPKLPSSYRVVGRPIKRPEIAQMVFCEHDYVVDKKVPGMMHGRVLRPPVAGAVPRAVDEASIRNIAGARVVWRKDFLAVVAETEWDAIRAQRELTVSWSDSRPSFPGSDGIYDHIRAAPVRKRTIEKEVGDVGRAFRQAAKVIEAEYEWPFQSHASMAPGCALVEIKDGRVTCWTGSQKPHYTSEGVAAILGMAPEAVRATFVNGSGCYGRNDQGDAAIDAALLAQAVGRPVRVQYMRGDGHGWDPKGPASIHRVRAALDANDEVIGYVFVSRGFSRVDCMFNEASPSATLAGHLMGVPLDYQDGFLTPSEDYQFANRRLGWETVAPLLDRASPLRTSHLRDPLGPQLQFASESFIDEMAATMKVDPVAFRLRYLRDPRGRAVIQTVADRSRWQGRTKSRTGDVRSGWGFSYAQRDGSYVAMVAEIDVDTASGTILPRKITVAHDCGLVINPEGLMRTIEGNVVQSLSRVLWEEVTFDNAAVTSTDWVGYPILDTTQVPREVDIVIVDNPEKDSTGAGEASSGPIASVIANALFDATGVRLRRAPLTPTRVKAALANA